MHLRWDLALTPYELELEFWASCGLVRSYFDFADRWHWMVVLVINGADIAVVQDYATLTRAMSATSIIPASFIVCAFTQLMVLSRHPTFYWRHRNAITFGNTLMRVLYQSQVYLDGVAFSDHLRKQSEVKPGWLLVVTLLILTGFLLHAIRRVNFPLSFKGTILSTFLWVIFCFRNYVDQVSFVLAQPFMKQGLHTVCQFVHAFMGSLLFLPMEVTHDAIEQCADEPWWLACFAHLLGACAPVAHSYITELRWKHSFLLERGLPAEEPAAMQKTLIVVLLITFSYLVTYFIQFVLFEVWGAA